ncbi:MAG: Phosphonate utilization associated acetyltransferase, partial [uncultured Acetobacteraceae bacterium]
GGRAQAAARPRSGHHPPHGPAAREPGRALVRAVRRCEPFVQHARRLVLPDGRRPSGARGDRQVLRRGSRRAHQRAEPPDGAREPPPLHLRAGVLLRRRGARRGLLRGAGGGARDGRQRRLDRARRHRAAGRFGGRRRRAGGGRGGDAGRGALRGGGRRAGAVPALAVSAQNCGTAGRLGVVGLAGGAAARSAGRFPRSAGGGVPRAAQRV